jgi:hypothetical protein
MASIKIENSDVFLVKLRKVKKIFEIDENKLVLHIQLLLKIYQIKRTNKKEFLKEH